jgi:DNA-binding SARP family transcriptional activator
VPEFRVRLFGTLEIRWDAGPSQQLEGHKARELFCYLLLARGRRCSREGLATLLWPDSPPDKSKKYLRQAAWRVHATLDSPARPAGRMLTARPEWLQIAPNAPVWCDVEEFEAALGDLEQPGAEPLDLAHARRLRDAIALYRGDLLENWYQDWCLFERERLQNAYLTVLDRLCSFHEQRIEPGPAIGFALRILRVDPARERTHRSLMRLYLLAGDRTAALRQFDRCQVALRDELGVPPAEETIRLYQSIRGDGTPHGHHAPGGELERLAASVEALRRLQPYLTELHSQLERHIATLDGLGRSRA